MGHSLNLTIDSDLAAIEAASAPIRAFCSKVLTDEDVDLVEIALIEALTNIVKHGYGSKKGNGIQLSASVRSGELVIRLTDTGNPIPDRALDISVETAFAFDENDLDSISVSGRGIPLMLMSVDEVDYSSVDGVNTLTLTKRI